MIMCTSFENRQLCGAHKPIVLAVNSDIIHGALDPCAVRINQTLCSTTMDPK